MRQYVEYNGGEIIGPKGRVVCRVCVESMTTTDARMLTKCIVDALNQERPMSGPTKA